jgi:hypothetical protein
MQPYCPEISSKILDFINVKERSMTDAQISSDLGRDFDFDLEKKKEIFVNKIEEPLSEATTNPETPLPKAALKKASATPSNKKPGDVRGKK